MHGNFTQIAKQVYQFRDTCNVYVIKKGTRAILVDAGAGRILDHLNEIGVSRIDWVLHTHHHRDQCWGDGKLIEQGAKIAVPQYEAYLFENAEKFWNHKRIYDNYDNQNTFFTVGVNIPVSALL